MKSVLISIQPYWVFLIIAKTMGWGIDQEKTVEVRKNFPKDLDWNKKAIIYCSKSKQSFNRIPKKYQPLMQKFLGKVIGEFVCDRVHNIKLEEEFETGASFWNCGYYADEDCLSMEEFESYLKKGFGYGWHISNLVIYDKPKKLREFNTFCKEWDKYNPNCDGCKYFINCKGYEYDESDCSCDGLKPIERPPQSWCYVRNWGCQ